MVQTLTYNEKLLSLLLINFYEGIFGFILGMILNVTLFKFKFLKANVTENIYDSFLKMIISIIFVAMCMLIIREFVDTLPVIKDYKKKKGFYHPPPIVLSFCLFRTIDPIKYRVAHILRYVKKQVNIDDSPWLKYNSNYVSQIQNKGKSSLYILILLVILVYNIPNIYKLIKKKKMFDNQNSVYLNNESNNLNTNILYNSEYNNSNNDNLEYIDNANNINNSDDIDNSNDTNNYDYNNSNNTNTNNYDYNN